MKYKNDDMFYDVESLENVFTVAWWVPARNAVILSYLEDSNLIQTEADLKYITEKIYELHPKLRKNNTQIVFENIRYTGTINEFADNGHGVLGMQSFAKRMGLANEYTHLNCPIDKRETEAGGIKYHSAFYPVKHTDPDYNPEKHGYRFGYNSTNYDMTILSYLLGSLNPETFTVNPPNTVVSWMGGTFTAKALREFNDELFESRWKGQMSMRLSHDENASGYGNFKKPEWIIRKSWLLSGRYIDVSRLNEKLQKVGLKRLLGMLGLQIMESDKLSGDTRISNLEEMAELLAYNISDVVNLQTLFEHKIYKNSFNVRGQLLKTYPQTVYNTKAGFLAPGQTPQVDVGNYLNVRRDRLAQDSTSAKFVELAIAPYGPIKDIPTVSFMYPSELEAKKLGIPRTDILEDTRKFFEENVTNDPNDQAHKDFMEVYHFYDSIRGKNFNAGSAYATHYGDGEYLPPELKVYSGEYIRNLMAQYNTNLFYHHKDETGRVYRSTCLANFSIGGIHGAEVNMTAYETEQKANQIERTMQDYVSGLYESATDALNSDPYIYLPTDMEIPERLLGKVAPDGKVKIREFVKSGSTKKKATWREVPPVDLFKRNKNGNWSVHDKYTYVSVGPSHHEDFTSYYPLLLSRLSVFINPDFHGFDENGEPKDPYYEMFLERLAKKKESKDPSLSELIRELANIEQESRKLLINAASGAGDATFDNNIRANNAVISMRIIGQLFAWRIGQAQTLAGAKVPSTNTDGLYTMNISAEDNDRILEEIAKDMHIGIEPERLDRFVSKDSNNRLEVYKNRIVSAKGGTLNSWEGPQPNQSLDHAAIIDHVLARYLADPSLENPANTPFDKTIAAKHMDNFMTECLTNGEPQKVLIFFQWILASSTGTHRYNYAKKINRHTGESYLMNLQHYNRIFLIKEEVGELRTEIYLATRKSILPTTWNKRKEEYKAGNRLYHDIWDHHPEALDILKANNLDLIEENKKHGGVYEKDEASMQKVRSMPPNQNVGIFNKSIVDLTNEEALQIINLLDKEAYLTIVGETFESWYNK